MTNLITLTIPNDDHIALRAFGKALEEMALAHGAPSTQLQVVNEITMSGEQSEALRERLKEVLGEPEVDTTAQQVESLAVPGATHIITERVKVGNPVPVDGGLSQGFVIKTEEIANPVDKTNTPWDERIHSASKALNADGTWRLRRKPKDVNEAEWLALVESVKAELTYREQMKEETEQSFDIEQQPVNLDHVSMNDIPEPPVTPPGDDFHTDAGVVTEQTVAGIPPIPVPPPVVVPPAPVYDFPGLMKFLTERHGRITVEQVNALLAVDGLAALTDLNAHPDKIGPFVARVKAHLGE